MRPNSVVPGEEDGEAIPTRMASFALREKTQRAEEGLIPQHVGSCAYVKAIGKV